MGVWTTWVPVGNVLMFNAAHPLLESFGWQAVWWFGALLVPLPLSSMASLWLPPGNGIRN